MQRLLLLRLLVVVMVVLFRQQRHGISVIQVGGLWRGLRVRVIRFCGTRAVPEFWHWRLGPGGHEICNILLRHDVHQRDHLDFRTISADSLLQA